MNLAFASDSQYEPNTIPLVFLAFLFCLSIYVAIAATGLQGSILSKPFSFCLPGHRKVLRLIIFLMGIVLNLVFAVVAFGFRGLEFSHLLAVALASSSAGMIYYLLCVWIVLSGPKTDFLGFLAMFLVICAIGIYAHEITESIVVPPPLLSIVAGTLTCIISWKGLGRDSLFRRICGTSAFRSIGGTQRQEENGGSRKFSIRIPEVLGHEEEFFLGKMKACPAFSARRYALGNIYFAYGRFFKPWQMTISIMIGVMLFSGYIAPTKDSFVLFILPTLLLLKLDLIPHRAMLLASGRYVRFCGALATGLAIALLAALSFAILATVSIPLATILPDIPLGHRNYVFSAINPRNPYLCLFAMPITMTLGTLYSKKSLSVRASIVVIAFVIASPILVDKYWEKMEVLLFPESTLGIIGLVVTGWMIFTIFVGHHCRKQDLVGQGR